MQWAGMIFFGILLSLVLIAISSWFYEKPPNQQHESGHIDLYG